MSETEAVLQAMLTAERQAVKEQYDAGASSDEVNESGIVAAEYYEKRVRYSHVIYLTSLLETFLDGECERLTSALGEHNILFKLKEINGDQWTKRHKFLERYGRFELSGDFRLAVEDLITLRNSIVHDNGEVSKLKQQARERLAQILEIDLSGLNIKVEAEYITRAFAAVKGYSSEIDERVKEVIQGVIQAEDKA